MKVDSKLTIHSFSLDGIVALVFGEEEFEVLFGCFNVSDLVILIDKITRRGQ